MAKAIIAFTYICAVLAILMIQVEVSFQTEIITVSIHCESVIILFSFVKTGPALWVHVVTQIHAAVLVTAMLTLDRHGVSAPK